MNPPQPERQYGFTLMEVLVALVLVSTALSLVISGLGRTGTLFANADLHATARTLALQKIDEFSLSDANRIADENDQFNIQGVPFGYKLRYQPVPSSKELPLEGTPLSGKLLSVQVTVYWGDPNRPQTLTLETLVLRP